MSFFDQGWFQVRFEWGAGAVIDELPGDRSPEANAARMAFLGSRDEIDGQLLACSSGRELVERGWEADVLLASQLM